MKSIPETSTSERSPLGSGSCSEALVVTLEVTCWSFSLGGEHYTGSVKGYQSKGKFHSMKVTHRLTAKQALALNKKDGSKWGGRHKPANEMNAMRKKVGGYEGDEETCTKLFHAYRKMLASLISQNTLAEPHP